MFGGPFLEVMQAYRTNNQSFIDACENQVRAFPQLLFFPSSALCRLMSRVGQCMMLGIRT